MLYNHLQEMTKRAIKKKNKLWQNFDGSLPFISVTQMRNFGCEKIGRTGHVIEL